VDVVYVRRVASSPSAAILLVDDEPANLLALEAVLHTLGEPLVRAHSGQQAMRALRDWDFAAVLLDVHMPGMDGFETARLIRAQKRSRETPIIFITADGSELSSRAAYAMGAVDFLLKPLEAEVLKAKLAFFIELYRSRRELQAAERQAVQDRVFLTAVLEAIEDGIVACDPKGRVTLSNRAMHGMLAMRPEARDAGEWPPPDVLFRPDGTPLPREEAPLLHALSGEPLHRHEFVIAPSGQEPRTVVASGQALYDESGAKLGAVVSLHDVTAYQEAQTAREAAASEQIRREEAEAAAQLLRESREQLRGSEERVRLATEAAGLGVWVWDPATDVVTWENDRMYELFGMPRTSAPLSGRRLVEEFVDAVDVPALRERVATVMKDGGRLRMEGRVRRKHDGALRWVEVTGILQPSAQEGQGRILGTVADITERRRAEEALRASELRYRTLFESMDQGFCIIEVIRDEAGRPADYRFLEINPAFAKHTGMQDAVGRLARDLVPDLEQQWFDTYGKVAQTGEAVRFESEAHSMGRWFDVYVTRLGGNGSEKVAILFSDITQRKVAQGDLERLARELAVTDRRKTEFLATLAHELRNPLAPISNGLHLMRMAPHDARVGERARAMMERQLKHMVHLVDDLLDIARISSNKVELRRQAIDLRDVLNSAVETSSPLVASGSHSLEVRLPDDALPAQADATRIAQVVSNLLNNAAKYTPPGGRIVLEARREDGAAVICVSDTGIGIPAEELDEVFEMFTQVGRNRDRSQGGLGIGLALVKRLVELHGGSVSAQSGGNGAGSTFTVRLPLSGEFAPTGPKDSADASGTTATESLRILVVDDNVDAAESLAALLEIEGNNTRTAHDGDQALAVAREFRPQIVFLDIGMPGKDGYQVAREMRADPATAHAVLIALTGWGAQEDRARSRTAGFDHHLTKPASMSSVETLLREVNQSGQAVPAH
jgi:PAS domain S-box-containing protein